MDEDKWTGRELRPGDMDAVGRLLERARLPEAVFVKAAFEKGEAFKGWWYGGLRNGTELEAVMAIENHKAQIYAHSEAAARGLRRPPRRAACPRCASRTRRRRRTRARPPSAAPYAPGSSL